MQLAKSAPSLIEEVFPLTRHFGLPLAVGITGFVLASAGCGSTAPRPVVAKPAVAKTAAAKVDTLPSLHFAVARQGSNAWIVPYDATPPVVFQSQGVGHSWHVITLPVPRTIYSTHEPSVSFPDPLHGWILMAGEPATVQEPWALLQTIDGGQTWSVEKASLLGPAAGNFPSQMFVVSMAFRNDSDGIIMAFDNLMAGGNLYTYQTVNGGHTWNIRKMALSLPPNIYSPFQAGTTLTQPVFQGVKHVSFQALAASGAWLSFQSSNDGATWHLTSSAMRGAGPT